MKKMLLILMGCLLGFSLLAQEEITRQLKETKVEPPRFEKPMEEKVEEDVVKPSPIGQYIQEELIIPEVEYGYYNEGIVAVEFTVEADRSVANFVVTNPVSFELDQAVIDCLKETDGMWTPGKVNGNYASMQKKVYVKFDILGNPSHIEMAKHYYLNGTDLYQRALANKEEHTVKADRQAKRRLNRALYALNEAMRYKPEDPSIIIQQAMIYHQQGDEAQKQEKLDQYQEALDAIAVRSETGGVMDMAVITRSK